MGGAAPFTITFLADIHGHSIALDAVLAALSTDPGDVVVCLGDVAIFGPDPGGVIARLQRLAAKTPCRFVQGNTDLWALQPTPHALRDTDTPFVNAIELWSAAQLSTADRAFLASFESGVRLTLPDKRDVDCFHGSPRHHSDILLAETPATEVLRRLGNDPAPIMVGAHTHRPLLRALPGIWLLNPGSVAQAIVTAPDEALGYAAVAAYARLQVGNDATAVTFHQVPYDWQAFAAAVRQSGMPHADWYLARWTEPDGRS